MWTIEEIIEMIIDLLGEDDFDYELDEIEWANSQYNHQN